MTNVRRICSGFLLAHLLVSAVPATRAAESPTGRLQVAKAGGKSKKQVLFFSKSSGFEHSVIKQPKGEFSYAEKVLQQLAATNNFQFEFAFAKDGRIFTAERIKKFDAFFFYTTGDLTEVGTDGNPAMTPEGKEAFLKAISKGKGFIGVHSSSDTFHSPGNKEHGPERYQLDGDNADPYVKMLGAEFIKHGSQQSGHLLCVDKKFPGCENFPEDFAPTEEWYSLKDFPSDSHVILVQDTSKMHDPMYKRSNYPETWARLHGKGRVFYTSMGHREDIWTNPVFQSVLVGGINWAVRNVDADVTPNINKVTPQANVLPSMK